MFDFTAFDQVFGPSSHFPYDRKFLQETETFRKSFDGALFIDRVLKALGITKGAAVSAPYLHHLLANWMSNSQDIPSKE
jgi:hypothetical protein